MSILCLTTTNKTTKYSVYHHTIKNKWHTILTQELTKCKDCFKIPNHSPCRHSGPPIMLCCCWGGGGCGCGWTVSSPSSEEEEDEEDMEEEEEEQGGGEVGGHWELWLGTADWELWEENTNKSRNCNQKKFGLKREEVKQLVSNRRWTEVLHKYTG